MPDPGTRATVPVATEPEPVRTEPAAGRAEPVREPVRREPVRAPVRAAGSASPSRRRPSPSPSRIRAAAREALIAQPAGGARDVDRHEPLLRRAAQGRRRAGDRQARPDGDRPRRGVERQEGDGRAYAVAEPGLHMVAHPRRQEVYRIRIDAQPGGQSPTTIVVNLGGGSSPAGAARGTGADRLAETPSVSVAATRPRPRRARG